MSYPEHAPSWKEAGQAEKEDIKQGERNANHFTATRHPYFCYKGTDDSQVAFGGNEIEALMRLLPAPHPKVQVLLTSRGRRGSKRDQARGGDASPPKPTSTVPAAQGTRPATQPAAASGAGWARRPHAAAQALLQGAVGTCMPDGRALTPPSASQSGAPFCACSDHRAAGTGSL